MKILIAAVLLPLATAHLCLLTPEQRGTISGLSTPGSDDCKLVMKDCGSRDAEPPHTILWAGMKADIIFQKNLDHFNMKMPGSFDVNMGMPDGDMMKWTKVTSIPDSNTTSLYIYQTMMEVPDMEMDHVVIQVIYNTNNPAAPPAFYQCADVSIKKPSSFN